MISQDINKKIAEALKARDEIRLSTLRMLSSAFNYEKIAVQRDLTEEDELKVIRREAKKRIDAIESLREARGKTTSSDSTTLDKRLKQEESELEILREFLPAEMADEELQKLVDEAVKEIGASEMKDMGRVIGVVMKKADGKVDGRKVAEMVKSKLT
ncbi:hypothetical protein A2865_04350 [Candidatus Woesebacteria bacterium RIFCSPHIGHO2_01_FULL_39_17]|uniref:GatB/Yqey n=3 Tax=Candidatus Woeseibacteriota TaxID=1752722 RepID=A0A0G0QTV3_9BACT|nr:MAG: hypothetical protein US72_C0012G0050 [Microgenomates group bacterium GW2011_GWC1_38_12]KKQ93994.1 MAG: GatB/Yqey [Candidatus Woesebacteria bacterium GW2011_GWB1_39_10b]KKR13785.1 MAG: GatB/Yqey [Candidatus Woesebacteria bacterium GW2011_GWA1_39_21b]OGM23388.1 MAG: hypothetical protein A2865_04350 [Candidatus Woesebacteria bacterium RIFCSPHIGHO2_01_FULL_39_17]OGM65153.1 MAG: hypothetical protein A3A52_04645 [Candidatus Woesebacteria bacterium RIFCSPLOWO2_01_FULL_39_14]